MGVPSELKRRHLSLAPEPEPRPIEVTELFRAHFDFVWRATCSLGVPKSQVDDAVQEVFLTAHRKLAEFEGRSSIKTWLYAITYRVAQNQRRKAQRCPREVLDEAQHHCPSSDPHDESEQAQAGRFVREFLSRVSSDKRDVFALCILEEMTAPDAAEILNVPLNTVYSRLRLVRADFRRALARFAASEGSR